MQSSRHKFQQPSRLKRARALGYLAWRQRDEAARRAIPPALPDIQPGAVVQEWLFSGRGWAHAVRLLVPADRGRSRPRSDQFALEIDGKRIADRASVSAALRLLQSDYLPRMPTRAERRELSAHTESMAGMYADPRGVAPVVVKIA